MSAAIAIDAPFTDDVRRLIAALNAAALKLTPREFAAFFGKPLSAPVSA